MWWCVAALLLAGQGPPQQGYVLGVDDQISVQVLDLDEIKVGPVRVDMRGNITLPMVGRLKVSGLTVEEVEAEIRNRLKTILNNPEVTVAVADFRSHPVSVLGSVRTPGVQQIRGAKTLAEVLSQAGGISGDAGNTIKIARRKEVGALPLPKTVDDPTGTYAIGEVSVKNLMEAKNPQDNVVIMPNDVITVPKGELVYVLGAVSRNGGFILNEKENITVMQAVVLAGGLEKFANKGKAKILRPIPGTNDKEEIPVDLKPLMAGKAHDIPMRANDILFIPISGSKQAASRAVDIGIGLGTGMILYRR